MATLTAQVSRPYILYLKSTRSGADTMTLSPSVVVFAGYIPALEPDMACLRVGIFAGSDGVVVRGDFYCVVHYQPFSPHS